MSLTAGRARGVSIRRGYGQDARMRDIEQRCFEDIVKIMQRDYNMDFSGETFTHIDTKPSNCNSGLMVSRFTMEFK